MPANRPTVVIDPAHGGVMPTGGSSPNNAVGPNGLAEKTLTLDLGRRVAALLADRAQVVLTRATDDNRSLGERAKVGRDANADVFLSIHLNGWRDPSADGSEAWVARGASAASHALARTVLDRVVGVTQVPDRGVREEDLGVLVGNRHAANTAAASLEVAFLTNPRQAERLAQDAYRQAIAEAIAGGIAASLPVAGAPATRALDDALDAARSRAAAILTVFKAQTRAGRFRVRRDAVADRALKLVAAEPALVQQGKLNLCGPAAFHRVWIERDPEAFARYLTTLYETGESRIGSLAVEASDDLLDQDYHGAAVPAMEPFVCCAAEWVAMSALRDSENAVLDFEGMPSDRAAGITTPGEMADWLRATGIYGDVSDEGNWYFTKGVDHALRLPPYADTDVLMLINAHVLGNTAMAGEKKADEALSMFPNHFVVLDGPVVKTPSGQVAFRCWTFGRYQTVDIPRSVFEANYYGAVIARLPTAAPSSSSLGARETPFAAQTLDARPTIVVNDWAGVDVVVPVDTCAVATDAGGTYLERIPAGVVIHVLQSTYAHTIDSWRTGASCFAPHYVIRNDGEITQLVAERFVAKHASEVNATHVGIEHDGFDGDPANFTDAMYVRSAALVRSICARNAIPVDRAHVVGHDELRFDNHGDPGGYWDWDYYMALVRWDGADPATRPLREVVDTTGPAAVTGSAAWSVADRDSGNAARRAFRENAGPVPENAYGVRYMWAPGGPDAPADDAMEFMFIAPEAGDWAISAWWPILADANTATQIEIRTVGDDGVTFTQPVDQRARSAQRTRKTVSMPAMPTWYALPSLSLAVNEPVFIRVLRRSDARGKVVADSFRFLRI